MSEIIEATETPETAKDYWAMYEEEAQAMAEASQYNAAANVAFAVDQNGIQWLLDILPDFMDNPIETQKVHEIAQYAKVNTFGKGVKI